MFIAERGKANLLMIIPSCLCEIPSALVSQTREKREAITSYSIKCCKQQLNVALCLGHWDSWAVMQYCLLSLASSVMRNDVCVVQWYKGTEYGLFTY